MKKIVSLSQIKQVVIASNFTSWLTYLVSFLAENLNTNKNM